MAQTTGQNLPLPQSPFVNPQSGTLSYDGYQYLLSLIAQALSNQATATVGQFLTATGANQATALQLSNQWNEVDTVASGTGVLLSSYSAGQNQVVFNEGSNTLLVYPPPGGQINALGENAGYSLAPGSRATFDFVSSTQIRT